RRSATADPSFTTARIVAMRATSGYARANPTGGTADMADEFAAGDWWRTLYDDTVAEIFMVRRDERETARTAWFLAHTLGLGEGSVALDQCCGIGTLALPLARTGVRVVGVD